MRISVGGTKQTFELEHADVVDALRQYVERHSPGLIIAGPTFSVRVTSGPICRLEITAEVRAVKQ
jgi:hypothetical protein